MTAQNEPHPGVSAATVRANEAALTTPAFGDIGPIGSAFERDSVDIVAAPLMQSAPVTCRHHRPAARPAAAGHGGEPRMKTYASLAKLIVFIVLTTVLTLVLAATISNVAVSNTRSYTRCSPT